MFKFIGGNPIMWYAIQINLKQRTERRWDVNTELWWVQCPLYVTNIVEDITTHSFDDDVIWLDARANGYFRNKYFPLPPNTRSIIRRRGARKTPKGEMTAFLHLHSRSLQHLCRCLFYFCSHRGLRLKMAWCFNYIFLFLVWSINRLDWSRVERWKDRCRSSSCLLIVFFVWFGLWYRRIPKGGIMPRTVGKQSVWWGFVDLDAWMTAIFVWRSSYDISSLIRFKNPAGFLRFPLS